MVSKLIPFHFIILSSGNSDEFAFFPPPPPSHLLFLSLYIGWDVYGDA